MALVLFIFIVIVFVFWANINESSKKSEEEFRRKNGSYSRRDYSSGKKSGSSCSGKRVDVPNEDVAWMYLEDMMNDERYRDIMDEYTIRTGKELPFDPMRAGPGEKMTYEDLYELDMLHEAWKEERHNELMEAEREAMRDGYRNVMDGYDDDDFENDDIW